MAFLLGNWWLHLRPRPFADINNVINHFTVLEMIMAIGNAVQRGSFVYVYDEKNRQISTIPAGNGKDDGLKGYTGSTVTRIQ